MTAERKAVRLSEMSPGDQLKVRYAATRIALFATISAFYTSHGLDARKAGEEAQRIVGHALIELGAEDDLPLDAPSALDIASNR